MVLNKTQVEISTHFDAEEGFFRCFEKVSRTLSKIFEMHSSRLAELRKMLHMPSKVSQFMMRNFKIYTTLCNQKARDEGIFKDIMVWIRCSCRTDCGKRIRFGTGRDPRFIFSDILQFEQR